MTMNAMTSWPTGWTKSASLAVALSLAVCTQSAFGETAAEKPDQAPAANSAIEEWTSVGDEVLAENRGGTEINLGDLGLNIASNKSTMIGNSVDGEVVTGQITGNALNDVSGINSVMMNSGNNVNFQNNMQINIFLK